MDEQMNHPTAPSEGYDRADVVVVGAGPTGLMLAGDLAEAGVRVTLLDRRPPGESNVTRAFAVHARTMEEFQIRGLSDTLARTGTTIRDVRLFGGARVDLSRLPSEFASLLITPQYNTERVLTERLQRLGVPITYDADVVGVAQDESGADVRVRGSDGGERTCRGAYVVGADGVRSVVRESLGLPYPGRAAVRSLMLVDVRLDRPPAEALAVNGVGDGFAFVAPFGDGWYRIFAWNAHHQVDDRAPVDLDEVREVTRRALGTDFGLHDARWLSRFHSDERQVPRYRVGRVFLAGDAAHCHSPAGGQGMNTGIQDAANLGWKLAAAVHGWGGEALLNSYDAERRPVGRDVLRSSGLLVRLALLRPRWARAARNALVPALLRLPLVADRVAGSISAIGVRYPAPAGADHRVGTRAANLVLGDGRRLHNALHGGRFLLITDRSPSSPATVPPQVDVAAPSASWPYADRSVLVRPDGYLAWVGAAGEFATWSNAYFGLSRDECGSLNVM
jgi:2-polyprenyl-6-methoxyphenol hydroxylase-like FAD-dependent oxidoreductase